MKKLGLILVCAALLLCSCGKTQEVLPQAPKEGVKPMSDAYDAPEGSVLFNIKNSIGEDIYEVRIAPSGTEEFGDDILKNKILKADDVAKVAFVAPDAYTYWDIRVLGESGNYYKWYNAQVGTFYEITLQIGENGPVFSTN